MTDDVPVNGWQPLACHCQGWPWIDTQGPMRFGHHPHCHPDRLCRCPSCQRLARATDQVLPLLGWPSTVLAWEVVCQVCGDVALAQEARPAESGVGSAIYLLRPPWWSGRLPPGWAWYRGGPVCRTCQILAEAAAGRALLAELLEGQ